MVKLIFIILIIIVMLLLLPWFMIYYDWVINKWEDIEEKRNKDE